MNFLPGASGHRDRDIPGSGINVGRVQRCEPRHSRSESIWGLMDNGEPLRVLGQRSNASPGGGPGSRKT